jgi:hypothetical protein
MKARLALIWIMAIAPVAGATDNSVEVTLEDTPGQQPPKNNERWKGLKFQRSECDQKATERDSKGYGKWRSKFDVGSDKPLGTPADVAAVKSLLPNTESITIRWVSRSVVVVSHGLTLCVVEKHRSKWKVTHRYPVLFPTIAH